MDQFRKQAYKLVLGQAADAFDLSREDPRLRERYGMHMAGQQALLARRLVEAGVSVVTVRCHPPGPWHDTWDDHPCGTHVFGTMEGRGPLFDQAVLATIYQFLGIDTHHMFADLGGRPLPLLPHGTAIPELIG